MLNLLFASGRRLERTPEEWERRHRESVRRAAQDLESLPTWEALSRREQDLLAGCFWALATRLAIRPDDHVAYWELAAGVDVIDGIWPTTSSWVLKGAFTQFAMYEARIQEVVMGRGRLSLFTADARSVIGTLPEGDRRRVGGALVLLAQGMIATDGEIPRDVKKAKAASLLQALGVDTAADLAWVREHGL